MFSLRPLQLFLKKAEHVYLANVTVRGSIPCILRWSINLVIGDEFDIVDILVVVLLSVFLSF